MTPHHRAADGTPPLDDGAGRRPDASMTLLRELFERPHGPDYSPPPPRDPAGGKRHVFQEVIVLILTIAIGAGGVWAARQLRLPVDSALAARTVLEEQITDRSAVTESLRDDIEALRAEISDLKGLTSSPAEQARERQAEIAAIHAGTIAVSGPGVEVELEETSRPTSPEQRVLDVDLQVLVNGLWASGAEAISINDRRLAYGTAIRTAGEVILVDLQPVQSPYVVRAIGDPDRLVRNFAKTSAAEHLNTLYSSYRISSSLTQYSRIDMPGGNSPRLTYAEPTEEAVSHGTLVEEGETS